ncbi:MAG TPA: oligosaccharide flippase family protein [Ferruginibacter sp.]|nr:oligosaccharide flippase family protein [Ferruginibacter sp.]
MSIVNQVKAAVKNPAYRSVGTYIFTNFFSKGVSFLLIPLFTNPRYLTPEDNGVLSLFASNMILLAPFISLGMLQSTSADYFKKTKPEFSVTFTTNFFVAGSLALLATLVLYIFRGQLWEKFELPPSFVYIIPALAFLIFCSEQLFILIRNRNEVKRFAVLGISKSVVEYSVSVVLIVFFFKGWVGRVWGIGISLMLISGFSIWYYLKNNFIKFSLQKHLIWEELKFGVPIFVFQLSIFLLGATNKLFLAIFNVDKHELGIYAIACILGAMVGTISQSIMLFIQPQLYTTFGSGMATYPAVKKIFINYFKMLTALSLACVAVVVFVYFYLINKIYLPGIKYFFVVALACYILALNYFVFLFLVFHKEKRKILKLALISIGCSIVIGIFMVKYFLIWGDALASLINTVIFLVLVMIFSKSTRKTMFNKATEVCNKS